MAAPATTLRRSLASAAGDQTAALRELLYELGKEALVENAGWLTLRRDRPLILPAEENVASR